ncbi:MAG: urease accessory protein [Planctomycetota bacterium]|jgi:urease accessory protein
MIHARSIAAATDPIDTATLAYDDRWRRRARMVSDGGIEFLLDLPEATELGAGMALVLEDGRQIAIIPAPEPLTEVRANDALHLTRLAWHLGNRHLPVQIEGGRLLIRRDKVLEDMLRRLGGALHHSVEAFSPEGGAYGVGRTHGHSHGQDAHADPNAHIRADDPDHGHGHSHGHNHSHEDDHRHHGHSHGTGE